MRYNSKKIIILLVLNIGLLLVSCLHAANKNFQVMPIQQPNPIETTIYPCYAYVEQNLNYPGDIITTVKGTIFFPSPNCSYSDGPPDNSPVILFMHGNGFNKDQYKYLLKHLAFNGFVIASVANMGGGTVENRSKIGISYLNALYTDWNWSDRLSNELITMGHSRGAEAAILVAKKLNDNPNLAANPNFNLKAVVAMAPTDGGGTTEPRITIDGYDTENLLILHATNDTDVSGSQAYDPNPDQETQKTGIAIYDRAGFSNLSNEGYNAFFPHIDKALVSIKGNHSTFSDSKGLNFNNYSQPLVKGYINAFLYWKVYGNWLYRNYFTSVWQMPDETDSEHALQFSSGDRRVIDNFTNDNWENSTLNTTVEKGNGIFSIDEGPIHLLDGASPQDTSAIKVAWNNTNGLAYLGWEIPNKVDFVVGNLRDFSDYNALSFRAAQTYQHLFNTADKKKYFSVLLKDANNQLSNPVEVAVNYPEQVICSYKSCQGDYTKSIMQTVRINLNEFQGVNLSKISEIFFLFNTPNHQYGAMTFANLELMD